MKYILSFFFLANIIGCEPGYQVFVRNSSSTPLFIRTRQPIESIFPKFDSYYDSVVAKKVGEESGLNVYKVAPFTDFMVWNNLGKGPSVNAIPFDYADLIQGTDTIVLDSKEKILHFIKHGNKKFVYYIELPIK